MDNGNIFKHLFQHRHLSIADKVSLRILKFVDSSSALYFGLALKMLSK